VSARFLFYQLRFLKLQKLDSSTAIPSLRREDLEAQWLVLAPIAEQERIVAAIEEEFSRIDAGLAALEKAQARLEALNRRLLEDTIRSWWLRGHAKRLCEVAAIGTGSTPLRSRGDYWTGGDIPWITSGLVNLPTIEQAGEFVTPRALEDHRLRLWPAGTLLIAMYGEGRTRGKCSELAFSATCNQACAAIVLHPEFAYLRPLVRLFFEYNYATTRRLASGGVQPNLNLTIVGQLEIPVPDARTVESATKVLLSARNALRRVSDEGARLRLRALSMRSTILRAAFSGRLASQDPRDEPAYALLERSRIKRVPSTGRKGARTTVNEGG